MGERSRGKEVSYEGTRENPIPVYYEDILNVFDMESDEIPEEKRKLAEKEGEKIPEFEKVPKYSIELYAVYAGENVYVAGFAE